MTIADWDLARDSSADSQQGSAPRHQSSQERAPDGGRPSSGMRPRTDAQGAVRRAGATTPNTTSAACSSRLVSIPSGRGASCAACSSACRLRVSASWAACCKIASASPRASSHAVATTCRVLVRASSTRRAASCLASWIMRRASDSTFISRLTTSLIPLAAPPGSL